MHEKDLFFVVSLNPSLSLYRTEAVCFRPAVSFTMAFSKPVLILCILCVIHERSALGDKKLKNTHSSAKRDVAQWYNG